MNNKPQTFNTLEQTLQLIPANNTTKKAHTDKHTQSTPTHHNHQHPDGNKNHHPLAHRDQRTHTGTSTHTHPADTGTSNNNFPANTKVISLQTLKASTQNKHNRTPQHQSHHTTTPTTDPNATNTKPVSQDSLKPPTPHGGRGANQQHQQLTPFSPAQPLHPREAYQKLENQVGQDIAAMVTPAFAAYFDIETPLDPSVLQDLSTPSSAKYQKRFKVADDLIAALHQPNFTTPIAKCRTFLSALAQCYIVDHALYLLTKKNRKGYCPICQHECFQGLMDVAGISCERTDTPNATITPGVSIAPVFSPKCFTNYSLRNHIRNQAYKCNLHYLYDQFLTNVHGP